MMKIDPVHLACRYEFEAAWLRACGEEAAPREAASFHARAAGNEAAAEALWETLAERGLSRPGCFVKQNGLQTPEAG